MLGKLLKYDLKWIYKVVVVFYVLALIFSVIGRGLSEIEVNKRNEFYTQFIKDIKKNIDVQFITPSIYDKE